MGISDLSPSRESFGLKGGMINLGAGDATLPSTVKAVLVCTAGNVVYKPVNSISNTITLTGIGAGYVLPHIPGVIVQSGTTATLATIED
jgi:hypothetical protein